MGAVSPMERFLRWNVFSDGTVSPMGMASPMGRFRRRGRFCRQGGFCPGLRAGASPERLAEGSVASPGVSPPRVYLSVTVPGCVAFPLAGFAGKPRAQAIGSRGFARGTEQKKRSSGFSFFAKKNKDVCAHTWFFENNCIVLQCAFGARQPGFGKGRPAAGARVRRGGVGPIRRIPQQAGFRAGVKTTGTRCRRTETRTYPAKPD